MSSDSVNVESRTSSQDKRWTIMAALLGTNTALLLFQGIEQNRNPNATREIALTVMLYFSKSFFGVSFIVLAPEHELVKKITTKDQEKTIKKYQNSSKLKTERERISNLKTTTGAFTGAYVKHPFTNKKIPLWITNYVLDNYGTGVVMGVPAHDTRDFEFSKKLGYNSGVTEGVK